MRDRIISKIMSEKFDKKIETIMSNEAAFATVVYESIEGINKIAKMPVDWFVCSSRFTAYFNGEISHQIMITKKPIPYFIWNSGIKFALEHPLTQQRIVMKQEAHDFALEQKALREELKKVLYSVTTDKRLLDIWPEATKWLPSPTVICLPANADVDKLRSLLKPL